MILAAALSVALAGVFAAAPRTALTVSPAHVALDAGSRAAIRVEARTGSRLVLRASVAGLALGLRGKPRIAASHDAAPWLSVSPRTVDLGRAGATILIASRRQPSARPGDHTALVLLTATAGATKGMAVRLRVGVVVTVRVKGRRVHRVVATAARARRAPPARGALIEVTLANRGNVIESIGGASLRITLLHRGRVIARLTVARRKVLPHTIAVVTVHYRGRSRGAVTVRVAVTRPSERPAVRSFPLRL
ncbi:MAG: hypothetical protein ACJ757_12105 [Gaiellaceae bacterium]